MIPLAHDFAGETVLVFGGGPVGARKARRFSREADVVVVSPSFADEDFGAAAGEEAIEDGSGDAEFRDDRDSDRGGDVELVRAAPDPSEGEVRAWVERTDPALVVAATDDPSVNEAAATASQERGALLNRADHSGDRDPRDVAVPATVREDPVVVSISTGGASPALAGALRERLEDELESAGAMAELTAGLRERLRADDVPPSARHEAVRAVARSPRVWTGLRAADPNVRETAEDVVADVLEDP